MCNEGSITTTAVACLGAPGPGAGKLECFESGRWHRHGFPWSCPALGGRCTCDDGTVMPAPAASRPDGSIGDCGTDPAILPHPVTFTFTNTSGKDVGLWHGCTLEYSITGCASGFTKPIPIANICGPVCPDLSSVTCGGCMDEPAPVSTTASVTDTWVGYAYVPDATHPCAEQIAMPAGHYRISVPVYPGHPSMLPTGGYDKRVLYTVTSDFDTPTAEAIRVAIDREPGDGGP